MPGAPEVDEREAPPELHGFFVVRVVELGRPGVPAPGVLPAELPVVEDPGGDVVLGEDVLEPVGDGGFSLGREPHHNDVEFFVLCRHTLLNSICGGAGQGSFSRALKKLDKELPNG